MANGNLLGGIGQGLESFLTSQPLANIQQRDEQRELQKQQDFLAMDKQRQGALFQDAQSVNTFLKAGQTGQALNVLSNRMGMIEQFGGDPSDTKEIADLIAAGDIQGARSLLDSVETIGVQQGFLEDLTPKALSRTAGEQEFASLTKGLTPEQKKEATLIKLGLSPRAVGSAIQTISEQGIEDQIGKSKATIRQREKFGELTASRRSKVIDSGFGKIEKIDTGIRNIDRAISSLNAGAGVGSIQKLLPSFRAASVELDNIQKSMALDVIGATTFGALSEGELNLAKEVALPTGLDTPQLIQHLQDRKAAQEKLKSYYSEQIDFLDQGGTVAGFLRKKERETDQQPSSPQPSETIQTFNFDAQGNLIQ